VIQPGQARLKHRAMPSRFRLPAQRRAAGNQRRRLLAGKDGGKNRHHQRRRVLVYVVMSPRRHWAIGNLAGQ